MNLPTKGIVTSRNWLMAPDGNRYLNFFSTNWKIVTDIDFPITAFHSREKWSLVALLEEDTVGLIPGCEVCGFLKADACPTKTPPIAHKPDEPDFLPGIYNFDSGLGIH